MASVSRRGDEDGHDPEVTSRRGMSTEGGEVDDSETMASAGASGTATGPGEAAGTGAPAAEGVDVDEGDLDFFEENESED